MQTQIRKDKKTGTFFLIVNIANPDTGVRQRHYFRYSSAKKAKYHEVELKKTYIKTIEEMEKLNNPAAMCDLESLALENFKIGWLETIK